METIANEIGKHFPGTSVQTTAPGEKVAVAERKIRLIKERSRAIKHSLPWNLPTPWISWLVLFANTRVNLMYTSSRPDNICPKEAFTGRRVSIKQEARVAFGD